MDKDTTLREQIITQYKGETEKFLKYIPWLEEKAGVTVSSLYQGDNITEHSVSFPVYDGTLMSFIKEAQATNFMNRNYPYVYSRYRIRTVQDEKRAIAKATITDVDLLGGILSKYVLGGMTKGTLWNTAVQEGIFLDVVLKLKEIIEFWDKPLQ